MKAVLRVAWLYFTLFPIQRWLAVAAAVLAVVTLAVGGFTGPRADAPLAPMLAAALALPAGLILLPGLLAAGAVFRYLCAPSGHALLPRFRLKMLASLLVLTGVICASVALLALGAVAGTPARIPPLAIVGVAAMISACIYFIFRFTHMTRGTIVEGLAWILLVALIAEAGSAGALGALEARIGTGVLLLGWIAFAAWYLAAPRIAPVDLTGQALQSRRGARLPHGLSTRAATGVLLTGRPPAEPGSVVLGTACVAVCLCLFAILLARLGITDESFGPLDLEGLIALGAAAGTLGVHQFASRARCLWLLYGDSRAELFRRVERVMVTLLLFAVVFGATLLAALHVFVAPIGAERALTAAAVFGGLAGLLAYLGLARARNVGPAEIGGWIVASMSSTIVYAGVGSGAWPRSVLIGLVALQIAAAALLRAVAKRRWRAVDWLEYRMLRPGSVLARR